MVALQPTQIVTMRSILGIDGTCWRILSALLTVTLWCGCSTHAKRIQEPRNLFYGGNLEAAHERLEKLTKSAKRDRDVVQLDLAMVDLIQGRPRQAEIRLREIRDRFDHLEQKSVTESTVSMWTDDQTRSYAGEDYEKVFIRTFLAICSLLQDGVDAEAYSLQINEKQMQLAESAAERLGEDFATKYSPVPFGYYLRGILREATQRDYDDAARAYQTVADIIPSHPLMEADVHRVTHGVHSAPGNGVLYVFGLVGRGPQKIEVEEQATSDALLIADRIVSAMGPYSVPPTLAPIKLPAIDVPFSRIEALGVDIDGEPIGATMTITDLEEIACSTFDVRRKELMARAVARRVVKKATVYAAKDAMQEGTGLGSLAMDAAGVLWEAAESADTRCWGLLPREIQVLRIELPAGRHRLSLGPLQAGRKIGNDQSIDIDIVDGRNSYALSYFPDSQPIGPIQVSK